MLLSKKFSKGICMVLSMALVCSVALGNFGASKVEASGDNYDEFPVSKFASFKAKDLRLLGVSTDNKVLVRDVTNDKLAIASENGIREFNYSRNDGDNPKYSISPRGNYYLYTLLPKGANENGHYLRLVNINTGEVTNLNNNQLAYGYPRMSKSEKFVVFADKDSKKVNIYDVEAKTTKSFTAGNPVAENKFSNYPISTGNMFYISADGTDIYFVTENGNTRTLSKYTSDGTKVKTLATGTRLGITSYGDLTFTYKKDGSTFQYNTVTDENIEVVKNEGTSVTITSADKGLVAMYTTLIVPGKAIFGVNNSGLISPDGTKYFRPVGGVIEVVDIRQLSDHLPNIKGPSKITGLDFVKEKDNWVFKWDEIINADRINIYKDGQLIQSKEAGMYKDFKPQLTIDGLAKDKKYLLEVEGQTTVDGKVLKGERSALEVEVPALPEDYVQIGSQKMIIGDYVGLAEHIAF